MNNNQTSIPAIIKEYEEKNSPVQDPAKKSPALFDSAFLKIFIGVCMFIAAKTLSKKNKSRSSSCQKQHQANQAEAAKALSLTLDSHSSQMDLIKSWGVETTKYTGSVSSAAKLKKYYEKMQTNGSNCRLISKA